MTNHNITCDVIWFTPDGTANREYKLSPSNRIWPCNFYVLNCDDFDKEDQHTIDDPYVEEVNKQDPDWNNLLVKSAQEILQHPLFWQHAWTPGWNSSTPSPICVACCSNRRSEHPLTENIKEGNE